MRDQKQLYKILFMITFLDAAYPSGQCSDLTHPFKLNCKLKSFFYNLIDTKVTFF